MLQLSGSSSTLELEQVITPLVVGAAKEAVGERRRRRMTGKADGRIERPFAHYF
tara:strand:+ start:58594 stop:58755 length:162 start_codon:yes stop_codon:yes gene_type:complete